MSSYRERRCPHCGIVYAHQISGNSDNREPTSGCYCTGCFKAAEAAKKAALKEIPVKFKKV